MAIAYFGTRHESVRGATVHFSSRSPCALSSRSTTCRDELRYAEAPPGSLAARSAKESFGAQLHNDRAVVAAVQLVEMLHIHESL